MSCDYRRPRPQKKYRRQISVDMRGLPCLSEGDGPHQEHEGARSSCDGFGGRRDGAAISKKLSMIYH